MQSELPHSVSRCEGRLKTERQCHQVQMRICSAE